jgi:hypothetical protein
MAFTRMATNLFLSNASGFNGTQHSAAVRLEGASYVNIQAECASMTTSSSVTITAEVSDDGLNWRAVSTGGVTVNIPAIILATSSVPQFSTSSSQDGASLPTPISNSFLRLQYVVSGTSAAAIISAGINVSRA